LIIQRTESKVDRNKAGTRNYRGAGCFGALSSLSGNSLIAPDYWLDPEIGVNYNVVTQAPLQTIQSVAQIANLPLTFRNKWSACVISR
jgi:hypothetical protein